MVEDRGFKNIRLFEEWVARDAVSTEACRQTYRLIVVRKNLKVSEPRQIRLFDDYRYFFYLTNDRESTLEEIVFTANERCKQENMLAQLKAVRALQLRRSTI